MYAQKFDADGDKLWDPEDVEIIENAAPNALLQDFCVTDDNGYVAVWLEYQDDYACHVCAQKIDNDGSMVWGPEGATVCDWPEVQNQVRLLGEGADGGVFVVWCSGGYYEYDLYASLLSAEGSLAAGWQPNGTVISSAAGAQGDEGLDICSDDSGGVFFAWVDTRNGGYDVYAHHFDHGGNSLWQTNGQPVSAASYSELGAVITKDGGGGCFIAWHHHQSGSMEDDIHAARLDADGNSVWGGGITVCSAPGSQINPAIDYDGQGGAVLAWWDRREMSTNASDIYAQRINNQGSCLWLGSGLPVCAFPGQQSFVSVSSDGAGGAFLAWIDQRWGYPQSSAFAQYIDASGNIVWETNGIMLSPADGKAEPVKVEFISGLGSLFAWGLSEVLNSGVYMQVVNFSGGQLLEANGQPVSAGFTNAATELRLVQYAPDHFCAVWKDLRDPAYDSMIYLQLFGIDASMFLADNGIPICTDSQATHQDNPAVVPSSDGCVIAAWQDCETYPEYRIYAQKINALGNVLWDSRGIRLSSGDNRQTEPVVCPDAWGGAFVAWTGLNAAGIYKAYVQRIDETGSLPWGSLAREITGNLTFDESVTGIVPDGDGNTFVVWYRTEAPYQDIYVARIASSGDTAWVRCVCDAPNSQFEPRILAGASGGAILAWLDGRPDSTGIYAQKIDAGGNVLWSEDGVLVLFYSDPPSAPVLAGNDEDYVYITPQYQDYYNNRIRLQRLSANGERLFGESGIPVGDPAKYQYSPVVSADSGSGVHIAWCEMDTSYSSPPDLRALHLNADGLPASPLWSEYGNAVCNIESAQDSPTILPDGIGGAIVAWNDYRSGVSDLYMRRIYDIGSYTREGINAPIIDQYLLYPPHPNPFNPTTVLRFDLPVAGLVKLEVFDINGRTVLSGSGPEGGLRSATPTMYPAGTQQIPFDCSGLPSGIYLARLTVGDWSATQKLVLMK